MWAAVERKDFSEVQRLCQSVSGSSLKSLLEKKINGENTVLHVAARVGDLQILSYLCEHGADMSSKGLLEYTPLHFAAQFCHLECVSYLCEQGADIHARDKHNDTALHRAAYCNGIADCVKYLCEHGADIHAKDNNCNTALHLAAYNGKLDPVKYLCTHGADKNSNSGYGCGFTPLHFAVQEGHTAVAKYLLQQKDVNLGLKIYTGETASDIATKQNNQKLIDLFNSLNMQEESAAGSQEQERHGLLDGSNKKVSPTSSKKQERLNSPDRSTSKPQASIFADELLQLGVHTDLYETTTFKLQSFSVDENIGKGWHTADTLTLKVDSEMFDRGTFRNVYKAHTIEEDGTHCQYVVKRYNATTKEAIRSINKTLVTQVKINIQANEIASYYAAKFSNISGCELQYHPVYLAVRDDGEPVFIERLIEFGTSGWVKYVNNNGEVFSDADPQEQDICEAFVHYTLDKSDNKLMVTDIQGRLPLLIDPEIATHEQRDKDNAFRFCAGNLSVNAIRNFADDHHCSSICERLELKPITW